MLEKEIVAEFDAFANSYDDVVINDLNYSSYRIVPQKVLELFPNCKTILDLGCATGLSGRSFLEAGKIVDGVDISANMLQIAKRYPYRTLKLLNIETDLTEIIEKYDVVTLIGVLEFINEPLILLKKIINLLNSQGCLAITVPLFDNTKLKDLNISLYTDRTIIKIISSLNVSVLYNEKLLGYELDGKTINYSLYILKKL
jgi:predicted TPR repeat methyltransferase